MTVSLTPTPVRERRVSGYSIPGLSRSKWHGTSLPASAGMRRPSLVSGRLWGRPSGAQEHALVRIHESPSLTFGASGRSLRGRRDVSLRARARPRARHFQRREILVLLVAITVTYAGPPDRPSDAWRLHPPFWAGTRCRLALTPGRPPQNGGLRAGDGLARGRGVSGRPGGPGLIRPMNTSPYLCPRGLSLRKPGRGTAGCAWVVGWEHDGQNAPNRTACCGHPKGGGPDPGDAGGRRHVGEGTSW